MKPTRPIERVLSNVERDANGCWVWRGCVTGYGYGAVSVGGKGKRPHRVSYEFFRGPIPEGIEVDHRCRNRLCANPDHLEAVTQRVNTLRGTSFAATNAAKQSCHRGHAFDAENTRHYFRNGWPVRACRACERIRRAARSGGGG